MPRGNDYLLPGDQVILFLSPNLNSQIDRLFAGNKQGFMETTKNI